MTWNDFSNLTAAQRTKLAEFATIGTALGGRTPTMPDISAVTHSQAKAAEAFTREMYTLVGPAIQGIKYVQQKKRDEALVAYEEANP